jgi:hypothetical protein
MSDAFKLHMDPVAFGYANIFRVGV